MLFMGLFSAAMTLSIQVPTIGAGLGFIGIKNRSQQDIIDRISVKDALAKE